MTPLVLGCLAVLLAGPVPSLMSRWHALRHTPVAAMLLWQSVAMAAVISAVGAGLSLTTAKAWRNNGTIPEYARATVALGLTLLAVCRPLLTGHRVGPNLRAPQNGRASRRERE